MEDSTQQIRAAAKEQGTSRKVVLVIGGTSGIGLSTAKEALGAGHAVFVTGRSPTRLKNALAELNALGHSDGMAADSTLPQDVRRVVKGIARRFGRIDTLVVCMGTAARGDLATGDPEEWRQMLATNVLGPAIAVRETLPLLSASMGQIVLVGSVLGRVSVAGSLYSVTKHALVALAEAIRLQVVGTGVRVCVVNPGRVNTPWWPGGATRPFLDPSQVGRAILWVMTQPASVDIGEIVLRPTGQQH